MSTYRIIKGKPAFLNTKKYRIEKESKFLWFTWWTPVSKEGVVQSAFDWWNTKEEAELAITTFDRVVKSVDEVVAIIKQ